MREAGHMGDEGPEVRVIRVMEYRYKSATRAAEDMAKWTLQGEWNGAAFKSATLPFEALPFAEGGADAT